MWIVFSSHDWKTSFVEAFATLLSTEQTASDPSTALSVADLFSPMKKAQLLSQLGFLGCKSLTMTYFHTGTRTIIGADAFHCPVRDGKEWYHVAMVIRHNLLLC